MVFSIRDLEDYELQFSSDRLTFVKTLLIISALTILVVFWSSIFGPLNLLNS